MLQRDVEKHNENFDFSLLEEAQELTKSVVESTRQKIHPGMKESEAYKLIGREFRKRGVRKFWHPIHVRFGENTLFGYKEKSLKDPILKENDIFFLMWDLF